MSSFSWDDLNALFEKAFKNGYTSGARYYNINDFAPDYSHLDKLQQIDTSQLSTPRKMELFRFITNLENSETIEYG